MDNAHETIEEVVRALDRLRRTLKKGSNPQVRSNEEQSLVKAMCLAWFNNFRPGILAVVDDELLQDVDAYFKDLLAACDRATTRSKYDEIIKALRTEMSRIRGYSLTPAPAVNQTTSDIPPNFANLVPDPSMREILERRWTECTICVESKAHLAATVMMGGLLEALLLARVHRVSNKNVIFKAAKAPKDHKSGKPLPLQEWTLRHYIDVAHELGWISSSAKDIGEVVRDYRNYIHPYKELSHGVQLGPHDAELFWEISKNISRQLLT